MALPSLVASSNSRQMLYSHLVLLHEFVQKAADEAADGETRLAEAADNLATIAENQLQLRQSIDTAAASISVIGDIVGRNPAAELGSGENESTFANAAEHADKEPTPRFDEAFQPGLGREPLTQWEHPPLQITVAEYSDIAKGAVPGWFVEPSALLTQRALPEEPTGVGTLPGVPSSSAAGTTSKVLDIRDADEDEEELDGLAIVPSRRPRESRRSAARAKPPALVDYEPVPRPSSVKRFRLDPDYRSSASSQSSQGSGDRSWRTANALALGQATAILSTIAATMGASPDEDSPRR